MKFVSQVIAARLLVIFLLVLGCQTITEMTRIESDKMQLQSSWLTAEAGGNTQEFNLTNKRRKDHEQTRVGKHDRHFVLWYFNRTRLWPVEKGNGGHYC